MDLTLPIRASDACAARLAEIAEAEGAKKNLRVAVLGGGIAGLTAAHELAGRGCQVTVYEMRGGGLRGLGGKARSQYFDVGGHEVPGEHGYRFMPAFYRCLPETMWRIPLGPERNDDFRLPLPHSVGSSLRGLDRFAGGLRPLDARVGGSRPVPAAADREQRQGEVGRQERAALHTRKSGSGERGPA